MKLFEWTDKFVLGVEEMDEQHRKLAELLNALHSAMSSSMPKLELEHIFDELLDYTKQHFSWEEKLMDEYDYTGFAEHNSEHEALAHQIFVIQQEFKSGTMRISDETATTLLDLLVHHILDVDKDFASYITAKDALAPSKTR